MPLVVRYQHVVIIQPLDDQVNMVGSGRVWIQIVSYSDVAVLLRVDLNALPTPLFKQSRQIACSDSHLNVDPGLLQERA